MSSETIFRLGFFIGAFALIAVLEILAPRRALTVSKSNRWVSNLAIIALNPLSVHLVFPILPVGMALLTTERNWGLLNNPYLPFWLETVIGVIALDLTIYLQHVLHHAVPLLWRLHMVHHADLDYDLTTGLRFHPVEIIVSMTLKLGAIAAFGPSVLAVLIFEITLNVTSMFNHSNIHIPLVIDRLLRLIVVTPDMHRVHHSVVIKETNSNYGFAFPWWDRLFGTYKDQPVYGHKQMTIGLSQFRDTNRQTIVHLLIMPFVGKPGKIPINLH
ncbi:MAG: sterol desaturase family protein [Deltaproteobacteria bacterium]|nr:sterol desaturase family protein [Deltaproteobacteria bacterium]